MYFHILSLTISKLESLEHNLVNNKTEKISTEDLNFVLNLANSMRHEKILVNVISVTTFILLLLFIFWPCVYLFIK